MTEGAGALVLEDWDRAVGPRGPDLRRTGRRGQHGRRPPHHRPRPRRVRGGRLHAAGHGRRRSRGPATWPTSTPTGRRRPLNDQAESDAIGKVFGSDSPPVTSIKGATGHGLGASGAIEAVAAVLTIAHASIPPTVGYEQPGPRDPPRRGDRHRPGVGAGADPVELLRVRRPQRLPGHLPRLTGTPPPSAGHAAPHRARCGPRCPECPCGPLPWSPHDRPRHPAGRRPRPRWPARPRHRCLHAGTHRGSWSPTSMGWRLGARGRARRRHPPRARPPTWPRILVHPQHLPSLRRVLTVAYRLGVPLLAWGATERGTPDVAGRPVDAAAPGLRAPRSDLHQARADHLLGRGHLPRGAGLRVPAPARPGPARAVRRGAPDRRGGPRSTPRRGLHLVRPHPHRLGLHRPGPRGHPAHR